MMMHKLLPAALACLFAVPAAQAAENMVTLAEKSLFTKTGRYTEVDTLCKNFQKNYPKWYAVRKSAAHRKAARSWC
jgi:hypothetical protein